MNIDKLTIIITTYNSSNNICRTLNQLKEISKLNILISDDFSTDDTIETIKNFNKDKSLNITIHKNRKNFGITQNRIEAVKKVNTKYLMFIDSGDIVNTKTLLEIIESINDNDEKIITSEKVVVDNDQILYMNKKCSKQKYLKYALWTLCGIIFKKEIFLQIKFLKNNNFGEDINSLQVLCNYDFRVVKAKLPLYFYIKDNISLTNYESFDKKLLLKKKKENTLYAFNNIRNTYKNIKDEKYRDLILPNILLRVNYIEYSNEIIKFTNEINIHDISIIKKILVFAGKKNKNAKFIYLFFHPILIPYFMFKIVNPIKKKKIRNYLKICLH